MKKSQSFSNFDIIKDKQSVTSPTADRRPTSYFNHKLADTIDTKKDGSYLSGPSIHDKEVIKDNMIKYKKSCDNLKKLESDIHEIRSIIHILKFSKMKCLKYNNQLDGKYQKNTLFESTIQLSQDGLKLIITNKRPKVKHIFEADTFELQK